MDSQRHAAQLVEMNQVTRLLWRHGYSFQDLGASAIVDNAMWFAMGAQIEAGRSTPVAIYKARLDSSSPEIRQPYASRALRCVKTHIYMNANEIYTLRTRLRETQTQFGKRFGVTTTTVSHWESNRSRPAPRHLGELIHLAARNDPPAPLVPFRAIQYLGSKQRLAHSISDVVNEIVPAGSRVGDLFSGTGVVSYVLGSMHPVTAVDAQAYSSVITQALLKCVPSDFQVALTDEFWRDVATVEAVMRRAAAPLLKLEEEALENASAGHAEELIVLVEFGSLAVQRQRPLPGCPAHLAKRLVQVNRALAASSLELSNMTALLYFGGPYFGYAQAIRLDAIGAIARKSSVDPSAIQAALLSTVSEIVNTVGKQFAQPIKLRKPDGSIQPLLLQRAIADRTRDVAATFRVWILKWLAHQPVSSADHRVVCSDVLAFLEHDKTCAAYYADPPYTIDHYSRFYHVLETLVLRDEPRLDEMNKLGQPSVMRGIYREGRYQSPFCVPSEAPMAFGKLFALASRGKAPLILSYSPFEESTGARPRLLSIERMMALAKPYYRSAEVVEVSEHSHRKLNSGARNMATRSDGERLLLFRK